MLRELSQFDKILFAMYSAGLSYTEMAKRLGVGRGAIAGLIWRRGLSNRKRGVNPLGKLQDYTRRGTGQLEVVPKPRSLPYNPARDYKPYE